MTKYLVEKYIIGEVLNLIDNDIYIYGTGNFSLKLTNVLVDKGYDIKGYLDRDKSKHTFREKDIISVEEMIAESESFYVIVASVYYDEISSRLSKNGLIEYKDYCSADFLIPDFYAQTSYSQFGEDILIESIFKKINYSFEENGLFIDVGAYHPYKFSNTYGLYLKGWRGINIEPTPFKIGLFDIFRPEDINLNLGVSSESCIKDFYIYDENAYNTIDLTLAQKRVIDRGLYHREKKEIQFEPLNKIVEQYVSTDNIQFLNIDVEGHEWDVLLSYEWKIKPYVIAVEIFDAKDSRVRTFLEDKGYILIAKTIATGIFVLEELL